MGIGGIGPLLDERGIALGMAARGKRSALARMAEHMAGGADMGGRSVLAALLRRERLGSTGIGHGVAGPHALFGTIARAGASPSSPPSCALGTLRFDVRVPSS